MGAEALAEALRALADTLRFYRAMGVTDLPLSREYLPGPQDALRHLETKIDGCTRCKLCQGRITIVFGAGNAGADLAVIGEAPGAEEDLQGKPFVGRAGQLLTRMLQSVGWSRDQVYITNIVKCRPPGNRNPEAAEIASCEPFLLGQLGAIQPKVILALGTFAAQTLLKSKEPIGKLRGRLHAYGSIVLVPTFHPAFLLRNPGPEYRRLAWEDLKLARREYDRLRDRERDMTK
ncbi:MAG: uracil-DNA glycosylase [Candidatus Rokubacteria bacterium]|nr:uracil-DNA glycosylase [Candidatus Rokubacteria bacterium]